MINTRTAVLDTNPKTLRELTLKKMIKIINKIDLEKHRLPQEVGQHILSSLRDYILIENLSECECSELLIPLTRGSTPLKEIDVSGLPISEEMFSKFIESHNDVIENINISSCKNLLKMDLFSIKENLHKCRKKLHTLILGDTFARLISSELRNTEDVLLPELELKTLVCHGMHPHPYSDLTSRSNDTFLSALLVSSMSDSLTYLDLSSSALMDGKSLRAFKNLKSLILFNCSLRYPDIISNICELTNLRVLDLSQEYQDANEFILSDNDEEQYLLRDLVTRLPNLNSLDISCTGLVIRKDRHITILDIRKDRPFDFLGLFHTTNGTIGKTTLPAKVVASEVSELNILNALRAYIDRPRQLVTALVDLFNLYKATSHQDPFNYIPEAMDLLLEILTRHLTEQQVIIKGTAVLWYMIKIDLSSKNNYIYTGSRNNNNNNNNNNNSNNNNDDNNYNDAKVMRQIISRSLDAMHYHSSTEPILINCGLILLFLPDLVSEYTRVTTISLHMCSDTSSRLQNFGTSLINHLACQVTGDQKLYIGKLLAIEKMLEIIQIKIAENTSDETLEAAWCTLWNITDETLDNCKKFVENDGLNAFKICMDKFSENRDLLKNMMGLLGNVAECPSLRSHFMDADLLYRFLKLLSNPIDTIECSYNACGILAHIMSDGHQIWDKKLGNSVSRPFFLMNMRIVIACWPMNSKRNINYRSFEPIVRLLKPHVPSEAQYWALFALTNLTRVDPAKYCPMLVPHQGLESLRDIANQVYPTEHYVTNLAQITLYQYEKFLVDNDLFGLEQCDSIDLEEIKNFRPMEVDSAEQ